MGVVLVVLLLPLLFALVAAWLIMRVALLLIRLIFAPLALRR